MARIYLCDDDRSLLQFVTDALESFGHEVRSADNIPAFAMMVGAAAPDLAVLDLEIPGGGGPAAAAALPHEVPIIVLSGRPTLEQMGQFKGRAQIRFLEKPVDLGLLECALNALLTPRPA